MTILFWTGVLMITQAVGFVTVRAAFADTWLYYSLGIGVLGFVLLIVLRKIEQHRNGESGSLWGRMSDADDRAAFLDD